MIVSRVTGALNVDINTIDTKDMERLSMTTRKQQVTRRRFLGATATTAGGMLISDQVGRAADTIVSPGVSPGEFPSTDHFWYRSQPADLFVDSQRGNKAFANAEGKVLLSEDNGHTWPLPQDE